MSKLLTLYIIGGFDCPICQSEVDCTDYATFAKCYECGEEFTFDDYEYDDHLVDGNPFYPSVKKGLKSALQTYKSVITHHLSDMVSY